MNLNKWIKISRRYEANKKLVEILGMLVDQFPEQRFGQIICNYFLPEYREKDPFFEESVDTLNRLEEYYGTEQSN